MTEKADSSGGDPQSDIQCLVPGSSTKLVTRKKLPNRGIQHDLSGREISKTTRKSVMKTNTGSGSRCSTVEVNKILKNYKLY